MPRYHRGACAADPDLVELYRAYAAHLRAMIATMKRAEIDRAAEFHLFAYRILKHELTSRG